MAAIHSVMVSGLQCRCASPRAIAVGQVDPVLSGCGVTRPFEIAARHSKRGAVPDGSGP